MRFWWRSVARASGDDDLNRVRRALTALPIKVEAVANQHVLYAVSDLGRRLDVASYDAAYVELAARRRLPLATTATQGLRRAQGRGLAVASIEIWVRSM